MRELSPDKSRILVHCELTEKTDLFKHDLFAAYYRIVLADIWCTQQKLASAQIHVWIEIANLPSDRCRHYLFIIVFRQLSGYWIFGLLI